MNLPNQIELLAPARDLQCGITAINCGADAVYIGAPRFGARAKAGNTIADIAQLVDYAHQYWACVYVTLNTLLHDHEIPDAVLLIHQLADIGVDAVIIQDMGLLECDLPSIPLIASTQTHNTTPEKVKFLEQVGFQRVILARELSLAQIKEIRQLTTVQLESFVHGAICVCYSGQCTMSYALGGRSGNRGECAQPCRKRYQIIDQHGIQVKPMHHWLSLRDLNLANYLSDLIDAGISSFKIEGRLKDQSYVANIVGFYRQELDRVLAKKGLRASSSGSPKLDFQPDPSKTFNRGYTGYFIHGRNESPGFPATPKMVGERMGFVTRTARQYFELDRDADFHNGDGISFFDKNGTLQGTLVNGVRQRRITPADMSNIQKGTTIYRNADHAFLRTLEKSNAQRKIAVLLKISETNKYISIIAKDEDGLTVSVEHPTDGTLARDVDKMRAQLKQALQRTGDTYFEITSIEFDLPHVYFIPISMVNQLRRQLLQKLSNIRSQNRSIRQSQIVKNDVLFPEKKLGFLNNVLNDKARTFYQRHGVEQIEMAAESGLVMRGKQVMKTRYCIKHQLGLCDGTHPTIGENEPWFFEDEQGHRFRMKFDCNNCEMMLIYS